MGSLSSASSLRSMWLLGLLVALSPLVLAEIQDFAILLPPTELYIHYADGFVVGPGSIDLSELTFTAVSQANTNKDDDSMDADDTLNFVGDDGSSGGGTRRLDRTSSVAPHRDLDGGVEVDASFVDIVVFHQPESCANSHSGCDWTKLGVGESLGANGGLRWCCSNGAAEAGLCDASDSRQWQRIIINQTLFEGTLRSITVPGDGTMSKKLRSGQLELEQTGRYVVVFANCNEEGREVLVSGNAYWRSKHGYLPGELFQFMHFYTFLWAAYMILFLWYACLMKRNEASRIDIEKYIFATILLGLIEVTIRGFDYHVWNWLGYRKDSLSYIGIILGSMKLGISWALIVMVSLGWGVIRDSLGSTMRNIIVLSSIYVAVACACELVIVFAVQDMQTLSFDTEVELFDAATILLYIVTAIDIIFIIWILDALNGTMQYLENMSQTRKLERFLKLRTLLLFAILFAVFMAVFNLVDTYDEDGIVREEDEWFAEAAAELNYFFVLCGVAYLWKPNPAAKEYAYVMELPSSEEGGTELELSDAVPSAMSDDEDDPASGYTERFKIDGAEHT